MRAQHRCTAILPRGATPANNSRACCCMQALSTPLLRPLLPACLPPHLAVLQRLCMRDGGADGQPHRHAVGQQHNGRQVLLCSSAGAAAGQLKDMNDCSRLQPAAGQQLRLQPASRQRGHQQAEESTYSRRHSFAATPCLQPAPLLLPPRRTSQRHAKVLGVGQRGVALKVGQVHQLGRLEQDVKVLWQGSGMNTRCVSSNAAAARMCGGGKESRHAGGAGDEVGRAHTPSFEGR